MRSFMVFGWAGKGRGNWEIAGGNGGREGLYNECSVIVYFFVKTALKKPSCFTF